MRPLTPHPFALHPLLRNPHVMTLAAALLPRHAPRVPRAQDRLFEVEGGTQMLARCHWQDEPRRCPTLVLVHGLEGSSESRYMLTAAEKAFAAGFNALRVNQRTCGGTEALTATLYNSGLSGDYRAILAELIERDKLAAIFFAGYSMGGNLVFKMAGEFGASPPAQLLGIVGVCPTLDLATCVDAVDAPGNAIYRRHFVHGLKARMRRKEALFPGRYRLGEMDRARTVREFDDVVTAPNCGYRDAVDYYERASAVRVAHLISVPALILTAQDDPFVPVASFDAPGIANNPHIQLVAPARGGHCAFVSREAGDERYWAEARMVEFCALQAAGFLERAGVFGSGLPAGPTQSGRR
jgi:predicted alpha/beta-fold hydrolase